MKFQLRRPLADFEAVYEHLTNPRIKADANEAYYTLLPGELTFRGTDFMRYPDSEATSLRGYLSRYYGLDPENLLLSNGSSQVLEMLFWSYCSPGDVVLTFYPGFSMFSNYVGKAAAKLIWVDMVDFYQDLSVMEERAKEENPKVILLCNPNNPTGCVNSKEDVISFVQRFPETLFVIDEAYMDFSEESVVPFVKDFDNLLVTKTMSKAMGLANLRLGFVAGREDLIGELAKVKLPFNVGGASLLIGERIFPEGIKKLPQYVKEVKETLNYYRERMDAMGYRTFPTGANFIFGKPPVEGVADLLKERGVYIRVFHIYGEEYHRITAVAPEEREELMNELEEGIHEKSGL